MTLQDRVALVTGGGKGVGASIALRLAVEGCRVAVLGRDRGSLETIAREVEGLVLEADVTDPVAMAGALAHLRERMGEPSIVVQNAGIAESATLAETTDAIDRKRTRLNSS